MEPGHKIVRVVYNFDANTTEIILRSPFVHPLRGETFDESTLRTDGIVAVDRAALTAKAAEVLAVLLTAPKPKPGKPLDLPAIPAPESPAAGPTATPEPFVVGAIAPAGETGPLPLAGAEPQG